MLETICFKDDSMSKSQTKFWYKQFRLEWEFSEINPHSEKAFKKVEQPKVLNMCGQQLNEVGK